MEDIRRRVEALSSHTSDPTKASARIFVGNLKEKVSKEDLFEIFVKYGDIEAISVNKQGYGFVQFYDEETAGQAAQDEHGAFFKGGMLQVRQCSVNDLKKKQNRERSRSPRRRSRSRSPATPRGGEQLNRRSLSPRPRARMRSRSPPPQRRPPPTRGPPMDEPRRPNDCEIVVINKIQRDYAESVERRLRNLGLKVDLLFLKDEALLGQALDDLALRGTLYACVISEQHEAHTSVTLNVLYGVPQEHRNMPLDEALKFVAKNFREHLEQQRDRNVDDNEREIKFLLKLLIDSRYVSIPEYDRLIRHLNIKRDKLVMLETGETRRAPSPHRDPLPSQLMQPRTNDRPTITAEQSQQQLQEKILSLIGTPASAQSLAPVAAPVVSLPIPVPSVSLAYTSPPPQTHPQPNTFLNFNNPSVQEAIEKLMKNGSQSLLNIDGLMKSDPPASSEREMEAMGEYQGYQGRPGQYRGDYGGDYGGREERHKYEQSYGNGRRY